MKIVNMRVFYQQFRFLLKAHVTMSLLLLFAPFFLLAAEPKPLDQIWRVVLADGKKIGWSLTEREVSKTEIANRESMQIDMSRGASTMRITMSQTFRETLDGRRLGFDFKLDANGGASTLRGKVASNGNAEIERTVGGKVTREALLLPNDVLFPEAQVKKLKSEGFAAGKTVSFRMLELSSMQFATVRTEFLASEKIELLAHAETLTKVSQTLELPNFSENMTGWVDRDFRALRIMVKQMGIELDMISASKDQALSKNTGGFDGNRLLLKAPRELTQAERKEGLRYWLVLSDQKAALPSNTDEQAVRLEKQPQSAQNKIGEKRLRLDVCARCGTASTLSALEREEHLRATPYLQSRDPAMQKLAQQALKKLPKNSSDERRMQALEDFVRNFVQDKNYDVAYASALETLKSRSGDCTEHALLLAALGRASQIPTRVAAGYAYSLDFDAQNHTFVPHMWTQAYVGGRWRSFDAALRGFDAGHLTLQTGNGDPGQLYSSDNLVGNLTITEIVPLGQDEKP